MGDQAAVTERKRKINILKIFDVKIDDFVDKLIANGYVVPDMDPNREMDIVNI